MTSDPDHEAAHARIHLGCGAEILDGWTNLDIRFISGVDVVADVLDGLPFESARLIFAEHFIEHFEFRNALTLLEECRRVLDPDGVLRLSTPNLDWVWVTAYASRWTAESETRAMVDPVRWRHHDPAAVDCVALNKAFRAWGHRFLYNQALLEQVVRVAGFDRLRWFEYGQSDNPELRGLERHQRHPTIAGVHDVLVVEASCGSRGSFTDTVTEEISDYLRDLDVS